uniref:Uncharacterized protein n=1 Tax=Magallana gigas TaxID=29159 RepID=A0A8W8NP97_MAGGI|nr:uncharacterized protein LOC105323263 isoform X2 [Crassostrea gigas]|eukprot:XP_011420634.1 PREDICTED: uncharacterized protein LOC105323263 isoform X2 [Crassostrea gigas]
MLRTQILASVCCLLIAVSSLVDSRFLDQDEEARYDKRSWSDQRMAEIKALLGLKNQGNVIAHGLYDPYKIFMRKRTSSDQRIAELQALIALVHGRGNVAHGQLDPALIGRRKRAAEWLSKTFSNGKNSADEETSH